jgi:RNA polymerase sigma factor (TIGR02999 family)
MLKRAEQGDAEAAGQLLPLVYEELRKLAAQRLQQEKPGQTLQPTALVHEAYLRLVDVDQPPQWNGRGHFFAAAAEAMRRILVDNARRRGRIKHGGDRQRVHLDAADLQATAAAPDELLLIDDSNARLATEDSKAAELVKLRYFAGLSIEQAADVLGLSRSTAYEHWTYARAWLHCELRGERKVSPP